MKSYSCRIADVIDSDSELKFNFLSVVIHDYVRDVVGKMEEEDNEKAKIRNDLRKSQVESMFKLYFK